MSRSIAQAVTRFHSAESKLNDAVVLRVTAVDTLRTEHAMSAGDVSRALFPKVDKLTSRETSPVSHATTTCSVLRAFDIDPQSKLNTDYLLQAFRVSTGKVPAAQREAATKSAPFDGVPTIEAFTAWIDSMLDSAKAGKAKADPESGTEPKADTNTPATVVTVAPTLPELLIQLAELVNSTPVDSRGKALAAIAVTYNKLQAGHSAEKARIVKRVATAKAQRETVNA